MLPGQMSWRRWRTSRKLRPGASRPRWRRPLPRASRIRTNPWRRPTPEESASPGSAGAAAAMEVEIPDAQPGEGRSTFQNVLRERQSHEAQSAREHELCCRAGEAITGAFHRAVAYNALERLYERIVGKKPNDLSGGSRRSGKSSMDLNDDDDAEEDEFEPPRLVSEVPREVSRTQGGLSALLFLFRSIPIKRPSRSSWMKSSAKG